MKQQLHKTHGYGFDSSHAGWVNSDTILRGHTVEWWGQSKLQGKDFEHKKGRDFGRRAKGGDQKGGAEGGGKMAG